MDGIRDSQESSDEPKEEVAWYYFITFVANMDQEFLERFLHDLNPN